MSAYPLLFEIGCDELPAKNLLSLSQTFADLLAAELQQAQLKFKTLKVFATPRRIAVLISELISEQPAQIFERQGPGVEAAFDKSGTPTLACIGFARSCGVSTDQLHVKETEKGKRLYCRVEKNGEKTLKLLPEIIQVAFNKIPLHKAMRWGNQEKAFIRPLQWLVALYGSQIIPIELFTIKASNKTQGHRFHCATPLTLQDPNDYEKLLHNPGMVIADFQKRKHYIREQLIKKSSTHGKAIIDEKLLNEVTALVEWPVVLIGEFKQEFLEIPIEALITAMKVHQKCFPIMRTPDQLSSYFIIVSNIESKNPQVVIRGNERVINARLADAAFFFDNDLNHSLSYFIERLAAVVFQKKLGTMLDRNQRLKKLTAAIAKPLALDTKLAERAAELAKFDLMSEMVGEFPELQGIMGYYYARHAKEANEVAVAIKEHYHPRFSGDRLPGDTLSAALALADRVDLLVGILGVNLIPSGEKDPYALRRAAQGIIRIIIEQQLPLDLMEILQLAQKNYGVLPNKKAATQAFEFINERMRFWYLEQGVSAEIFSAVAACVPTKPLDFHHRLKAVQQFQTLPESSSLSAANKRVSNILKKSLDHPNKVTVNTALFENDSERNLAHLLQQKTEQINQLYASAHYTEALTELAALKEPVDLFFDQVMIMVDDKKIRANRIALLTELHHLFTQVADISLLP